MDLLLEVGRAVLVAPKGVCGEGSVSDCFVGSRRMHANYKTSTFTQYTHAAWAHSRVRRRGERVVLWFWWDDSTEQVPVPHLDLRPEGVPLLVVVLLAAQDGGDARGEETVLHRSGAV